MAKLMMSLMLGACAFVQTAYGFAKYVDITTAWDGGDVANFPVLVKITATTPAGFYTDVQHDGADLKFTDATGNGDYPYEIDTWAANGDSYIWVKLPTLSAGMTFRMYYGDEDQTEPTNPSTAVWTGYDLVCHVNGNANDSATPSRAGALNTNGSTKTDGIVGKTHGNSKADKGAAMINTLYEGETGGVLPDGRFSYSFWFRPVVDIAAWKLLAGPSNGADTDAWSIRSYNPTTKLGVRTARGSEVVAVTDGFVVGTWYKVDVAMDDKALALYVDGELKASSTSLLSSAKRCWVPMMGWGGTAGHAGEFGTTESLAVDVDECRIFSTVADANRVAADYQTVANVATFLSFSDPHGEVVVNVLPQGVIFK